jgi:hypothetical protein
MGGSPRGSAFDAFSDHLARVWCRLLGLRIPVAEETVAANGRHPLRQHEALPGFQLTAVARWRNSLEAPGRRTQCIDIASGVCCVVEIFPVPWFRRLA